MTLLVLVIVLGHCLSGTRGDQARLGEAGTSEADHAGLSVGSARTIVTMPAQPTPVIVPRSDEGTDVDEPWKVVVWNDPVNTMSYVVYVFRKLFGYDKTKATELMLKVHHEGRATVADGPREKAEIDCFKLHNHGLWATIEQ